MPCKEEFDHATGKPVETSVGACQKLAYSFSGARQGPLPPAAGGGCFAFAALNCAVRPPGNVRAHVRSWCTSRPVPSHASLGNCALRAPELAGPRTPQPVCRLSLLQGSTLEECRRAVAGRLPTPFASMLVKPEAPRNPKPQAPGPKP